MDEQPIKVLIVDDEPGIVHGMSRFLIRRGFKVLAASDGKTALEIFEKERPQINLIDIYLGDLDGIELLQKIKEMDKDAECIMVTRITDQDTFDQAVKLGARHYVYKPFGTEDWLPKVMEIAEFIKEREKKNGQSVK